MKKKKRSVPLQINFIQVFFRMIVFLLVGISVLCICSVLTFVLCIVWGSSQRQEQRELNCQMLIAEPISLVSERYICENDLLVEYVDISICSNNIVELTRSDIMSLYQDSIVEDEFTYNDVHNLFGEFETDCTSVEARENLNGYNCTYDFISMSRFIRVFYDNNDRVTDVRTLGCPNLNR